jgi:replication initiation and membrane attachment protein DnaB
LPFSVINALLDFVLEIADLTLPRALVEKIASSLARARSIHRSTPMEYLLKTTKRKKTTKTAPTPVIETGTRQR